MQCALLIINKYSCALVFVPHGFSYNVFYVSVLHKSGEFEVLRPSQHFKHVEVLLKPSLNQVYFVGGRAILLKEHSGNTVSMKRCTWSAILFRVGGTCQSNVHMDGRTQDPSRILSKPSRCL